MTVTMARLGRANSIRLSVSKTTAARANEKAPDKPAPRTHGAGNGTPRPALRAARPGSGRPGRPPPTRCSGARWAPSPRSRPQRRSSPAARANEKSAGQAGAQNSWSGQRDSNPRILAWEARALPLGDARVEGKYSAAYCNLNRCQRYPPAELCEKTTPARPKSATPTAPVGAS